MTKVKILTLLTDFGLQDIYVGVMKGAIASINPDIHIIDLTHQIPAQNLAAARFCLLNAYTYFPQDTVHVAVVDPGVGSKRRGVAIQYDRGWLVGADNGLFSGVLAQSPAIAAVELTNPDYWQVPNPSNTFHGRDIFAPVGAHLASGVTLAELGETIDPDSLIQLPLPKLEISTNEISGCVQYVDHFGNLVTNIPANLIDNDSCSVIVQKQEISYGKTYSDVEIGEVVALVGSHNWIEIAVRNGSAREKLQLDWGDRVIFKKSINN
ncbi:MAG: SAM-dependent chlorinase/fluorinase [Xenococcaceae cyanobacterium MO_188.B29]|nr:SAM-dependent chlorinase/fluorinase [Xenococcaceae cyanobacterium MO_188.B29]